MQEQIKMMEEFHQAFGHPLGGDRGLEVGNVELRADLIIEEAQELYEELWNINQSGGIISPNLLKEGADLLSVLLGTFVSLGLSDELIEAYRRVHISNMSKLGPDGPLYREDGKVLKGPNYKAPDLGDLIG